MNNVVGEIVLAVGDEDLLAGDAIGAVGRALGPRAQPAQRIRPGAIIRVMRDDAGNWSITQLPQIASLASWASSSSGSRTTP